MSWLEVRPQSLPAKLNICLLKKTKGKKKNTGETLVVIQLGGITNIYDMAAGSGPSAVGSFSLIAAKRWRRLVTHKKINTIISADVFNSLNNQLKSV